VEDFLLLLGLHLQCE